MYRQSFKQYLFEVAKLSKQHEEDYDIMIRQKELFTRLTDLKVKLNKRTRSNEQDNDFEFVKELLGKIGQVANYHNVDAESDAKVRNQLNKIEGSISSLEKKYSGA